MYQLCTNSRTVLKKFIGLHSNPPRCTSPAASVSASWVTENLSLRGSETWLIMFVECAYFIHPLAVKYWKWSLKDALMDHLGARCVLLWLHFIMIALCALMIRVYYVCQDGDSCPCLIIIGMKSPEWLCRINSFKFKGTHITYPRTSLLYTGVNMQYLRTVQNIFNKENCSVTFRGNHRVQKWRDYYNGHCSKSPSNSL